MRSALLVALTLAGCGTTPTTEFVRCAVDATLDATEAAPGATVVATGGPMSDYDSATRRAADTSVRFGQVDAAVVSVDHTECTLCVACRDSAGCASCETCGECATSCSTCVQTTTFVVPDLPTGPTSVVITNRFGSTDPLPLTVIEAPVDSGDTGGT